MKKQFSWDPGTGEAGCRIFYKQNTFVAYAHCHDDDVDFMGEKTGCSIAEMRADIKLLKHIKNNEILPKIEVLNHIYSIYMSSDKYDKDCQEAKAVYKELHRLEKQLSAVNNGIDTLKENLKLYIAEKEKFYTRVRKGRNR